MEIDLLDLYLILSISEFSHVVQSLILFFTPFVAFLAQPCDIFSCFADVLVQAHAHEKPDKIVLLLLRFDLGSF